MKLPWKVTLAVLALLAIGAVFAFRTGTHGQNDVEQTRRALRQQGFKLDLEEFNLVTSPELRARAAAITNAGYLCRYALRDTPELMRPVGSNAARVTWQLDHLETDSSENAWAELGAIFQTNHTVLDAACEVVLAGPIQFEPLGRPGNPLLPHAADVKGLAQTLALRTVWELHGANPHSAWTNLLALTRLVTAWKAEPMEVTHLVRYGCGNIAQSATWEALQTNAWTDDQLAVLQHEWESVNFFSNLYQVPAFSRANTIALCQAYRQQTGALGLSWGQFATSFWRDPKATCSQLLSLFQEQNYWRSGSYQDEADLMLYFRDRELEVQRAAQCATWFEMRRFPGITNTPAFQSKQSRSSMAALLNMKQLTLSFFAGQGLSLAAHTSQAEARRGGIVTAIALERYRLSNGAYPKSLDQLVPTFLKGTPIDFMDGQPLRYRTTDDRHFVLYSVGIDSEDNNGQMPLSADRRYPLGFGVLKGTDLVWPRPASFAEVEAQRQAEEETEHAATQP